MGGEIYTDYGYYGDYRRDNSANYRQNYSRSYNNAYMNSTFSPYNAQAKPKNEYDLRYNEVNQWLYNYDTLYKNWLIDFGSVDNATSQNVETDDVSETSSRNVTNTRTETENKTKSNNDSDVELTDDTEVTVDLGDGKTTTVKYKDLCDNIEVLEQDLAARQAELEKIDEKTDDKGNSRVEDDTPLSEMTFWQKAGRVGLGVLNGGWKFVKSFFGMEDGWKGFTKNGGWKRCLANLGMVAGTIALSFIPYAGPYIAAAFLWYTRGDAICNAIGVKNPLPPKVLVNMLALPVKYKDDKLRFSFPIRIEDGKLKLSKKYEDYMDWILPSPIRIKNLTKENIKKYKEENLGWAEGKGIYGMCKAETAGELESASESIGVALVEVAGSKGASKAMKVKGNIASQNLAKIKGTTPKGTTGAKTPTPKTPTPTTGSTSGAQKPGLFGRVRDGLKAEHQARKDLTAYEKYMWEQTKSEGSFGARLKSFAKQKREFNRQYCANEIAYEEQKQQMLDTWVNSTGTGKKQGLFGQLRNKNSVKSRGNKNDNAVMKEISTIEQELNNARERKINYTEKAQMDEALYGTENRIQGLKDYVNNALDGKESISKIIEADSDSKALFLQEMDRVISSERQFNRQYRQLYKAQQRAVGAQLARNLDPKRVAKYTGEVEKARQLWALNKKPNGMKTYKYVGKFGFKAFWDGTMLTYNGGKAFVGKPGSAYMIGRYASKPEAYRGELVTAEDIENERLAIEEYEEYINELKGLKAQIEETYGAYDD